MYETEEPRGHRITRVSNTFVRRLKKKKKRKFFKNEKNALFMYFHDMVTVRIGDERDEKTNR